MSAKAKGKHAAVRDPVDALGWTCIVLATLIALYWVCFGRARPLPAPVPPDPASLAPQMVTSAPLDPAFVEAMAARPLFLSGRRAEEGSSAVAPTTASIGGSLADARLVGILAEDDGGVAIVTRGDTRVRLRVGERLDDWTLDSLSENSARFVRGGTVHELLLKHFQGQTSDPNPVAPPPMTPGMPPPGREESGPSSPMSTPSQEDLGGPGTSPPTMPPPTFSPPQR
ncbi:MAG: hypothetical protein LBR05_08035 [Azoarcus sp.]|jgi:hypothetical protein|nr:hypothetical protein [Azoarcus sp.]